AVDGKKHAAKLYRAACAPDLTKFLDNLSGDAQHCRPRLVADGVEATIGLHTLERSRPTKTAGALDHQRAGPGPRRAHRCSNASGTAADHYDIVAFDVVRHENYTRFNLSNGVDDSRAAGVRAARQPFEADPRITLQKLPRLKAGSLSASTSAFTLPNVVSGLCLMPS